MIYPFTEADYIEILSYPNRFEWDHSNLPVISEGKVILNPDKIVDQIRISPEQGEKLYFALYEMPCEDSPVAACFYPRHSLIFYNSQNKAFAYIEICMECHTLHVSEGINYFPLSTNKIDELQKLFISYGITFFRENET